MRSILLSLASLTVASTVSAAITPNARINAGLTGFGNPTSGLSSLADGKAGGGWSVSAGAWVAWRLPKAPGTMILAWNNPSYSWSDYVTDASSCFQGSALTFPGDYEILTSSNSTNGSDGAWTSRLVVTGNKVSSRSHVVATGNDSWVKLAITAGNGTLDEVGIFDGSVSTSDSWAFLGTSISANTFKGTPPAADFASLIAAGTANANTPAVVKAGIPCIRASEVASHIDRYLAFGGSVARWAIEMGTNDAWGGGTGNLATFQASLQKVIDSAKSRGIEVMLARTLATNSSKAGWQVDGQFLTAIDDLAKSNGLAAGPDLYSWFLAHPEELNDDGVHPNATGAASIQRLWAEAALASVYARSTSSSPRTTKRGLRVVREGEFLAVVAPGSRGAIRLVAPDGASRVVGRDGQGRFALSDVPGGVLFLSVDDESIAILLRP